MGLTEWLNTGLAAVIVLGFAKILAHLNTLINSDLDHMTVWFRVGVWGTVGVTLGTAVVAYGFIKELHRATRAETAFQGKVVWITGASSGIGRALAVAFAERGALLVLSGRSRDRLRETKDLCTSCWPDKARAAELVRLVEIDLDDTMQSLQAKAARAVDTYPAKFAGIDVFVNNAGISSRGSVASTSLETDERLMRVNYLSAVALTKGLLPSMITRGFGRMAFISSVQGKIGIPYRAPYAASKHALQGFVDSLRSEIASAGISVTCVSPGYVATNLSLNAVTGDGTANGKMDPNTASGMAPADLAEQIVIAIANGDADLVVAGMSASLAIYIRSLWPDLFHLLMARRAAKGRKTGETGDAPATPADPAVGGGADAEDECSGEDRHAPVQPHLDDDEAKVVELDE